MSIFCGAKRAAVKTLIALPLLVVSTLAQAEVRETIDYVYYEIADPAINGKTLKHSLDTASPVVKAGVKRHGENRWLMRWKPQTQIAGDVCKITDVVVDLDALILLPELASQDDAVQQKFNGYVELLQEHLLLHYIIAIQAANKIELDITNLEPGVDCDSLLQQADDTAKAIVAQYREKEQGLDEMTNFGAEQGVVLKDDPKEH
ncbi:DUF922 domain-containing protein [Gilvimarinus sp. SDUM040013]|uniref:DUF922 domain-containing protein n=1 Tax=Gilvimarinus gilvus TaxID=3058038 RepID=A0ABU4S1N9_9GAMM|nr:DUF922 domain-containing protein [Gilvimarinus sp. SDUM040013]MDO3385365.1 DUF922 domain-containing protein [Gilvimarinus sp. SDUM040013]MDX6850940.1 DUF922 domain-containing protein [Gilvimarinus sp. SDUM040013]